MIISRQHATFSSPCGPTDVLNSPYFFGGLPWAAVVTRIVHQGFTCRAQNSTLNRWFADDGDGRLCAGRSAPAGPGLATGDTGERVSVAVLATPQRPSDRIEVRLSVNIGSLSESTQQSGFSHLSRASRADAKRRPPDHAGPFAMAAEY